MFKTAKATCGLKVHTNVSLNKLFQAIHSLPTAQVASHRDEGDSTMRLLNKTLLLTAVLAFAGCSEDTDDPDKINTPSQTTCTEPGQLQCGDICCLNGQICNNGTCQNPSGSQDACSLSGGIQCGSLCCTNGQTCTNGTCVGSAPQTNECNGDGETKCGDICCKNGQTCNNGQCLDGTPVENECSGDGETKCGDICCKNGQTCDNGQCLDGTPAENECSGEGESKCGDICCKNGQTCDNGQCLDGMIVENKCNGDGETKCGKHCCQNGQTCFNNKCVDATPAEDECTNEGETKCGDRCCSKGQICENNACKDPASASCFKFTDSEVEKYAKEHWDTNKDGCLSDAEINAVTEIPSNAFNDNTNLKSIEDLSKFPNITVIGSKAFADTNHLTGKAYFPHVTKIKIGAFWISGIEEVDFPEWEIAEPKNEATGDAAETGQFYKCQNLKKANLPKLKVATSSLFNNCTSLTEVDLPSVVEIQNISFTKCSALKSIKLTAPGKITFTDTSWKDFSTKDADILLNSDKKAGGSGSPLVSGDKSWAGADWKSISFQ